MIKELISSTHRTLTGELPPERACSVAIEHYHERIGGNPELATFASCYQDEIARHRPDLSEGLPSHAMLHLTIQIFEILRCTKQRLSGD